MCKTKSLSLVARASDKLINRNEVGFDSVRGKTAHIHSFEYESFYSENFLNQVYCLLAFTTASGSNNEEEEAELMTEVESADNDENAMDCDGGIVEDCESAGDDSTQEEEAIVEEEPVEEEKVDTAKLVANSLKEGRTCRLKTEGEKLSKIIRKAGKTKQKLVEQESVQSSEKVQKKVQTTEKKAKVKRDTRNQENAKKTKTEGVEKKSNQQKASKKNVKSSTDGKKNKKTVDGKKKGFKNEKKSSNKNQRNKKFSKNEL